MTDPIITLTHHHQKETNIMFNSARNSDVSGRQVEELDEAEAVLGHYLSLDDNMRPHVHVDLGSMATERAMAHPRLDHTNSSDLGLVMRKLQGALKELCVGELTRLERVHLDLTGDLEVPAWQSQDVPAIAFAALRSTDTLFIAGRQEAIAVYFDPQFVGMRRSQTKAGEWYAKPDIYNPEGYLAVCRSFKSVERALAAHAELNQACAAIRKPTSDTALEADGIRTAGTDYDIDLDAL